jgi:hypothetical protein
LTWKRSQVRFLYRPLNKVSVLKDFLTSAAFRAPTRAT